RKHVDVGREIQRSCTNEYHTIELIDQFLEAGSVRWRNQQQQCADFAEAVRESLPARVAIDLGIGNAARAARHNEQVSGRIDWLRDLVERYAEREAVGDAVRIVARHERLDRFDLANEI